MDEQILRLGAARYLRWKIPKDLLILRLSYKHPTFSVVELSVLAHFNLLGTQDFEAMLLKHFLRARPRHNKRSSFSFVCNVIAKARNSRPKAPMLVVGVHHSASAVYERPV